MCVCNESRKAGRRQSGACSVVSYMLELPLLSSFLRVLVVLLLLSTTTATTNRQTLENNKNDDMDR